MAEGIAVIGAGGFGREALDVIEAINEAARAPVWRVLGVFDDAPADAHRERLQARSIPWLGPVEAFRPRAGSHHYVVAIGSPAVRAGLSALVDQWGGRAATLLHPRATIGSQGSIECGSVVCAGVQISTNVRLGRNVHVNPGAIIGHDSELGDTVSINPGAVISGDVRVEERALVGAGAIVLQGLVVGAGAVVGAAACVTRSVPPNAIVKGVPARGER